jgi:hypothetical protein
MCLLVEILRRMKTYYTKRKEFIHTISLQGKEINVDLTIIILCFVKCMTQKVGIVKHPILSMIYSIVSWIKLMIPLIYPWVYKKLNMFLIYLTQMVIFLFPFNFISKIGKFSMSVFYLATYSCPIYPS